MNAQAVVRQQQQLVIPQQIQSQHRGRVYRIIDRLGRGGFAQVFKCVDMSTNEEYAVKVTSKQQCQRNKYKEKLDSEIRIHKQLKHENICQLVESFSDDNNYYMILELCSHNSLSSLVKERKNLDQEEVQYITWQILLGLSYLKKQKIIHRDLKSQNIFISESKDRARLVFKIGDFGLSTQVHSDTQRQFTFCGTPNFLPPETLVSHICKRREFNRQVDQNIDQETIAIAEHLVRSLPLLAKGHDFQADMWSLGCLIYQMAVGKPPYETEKIGNTYKRILSNNVAEQLKNNISSSCLQDFLNHLLVVNPAHRYTVEQALSSQYMAMLKLRYIPTKYITNRNYRTTGQDGDFFNPGIYQIFPKTYTQQEIQTLALDMILEQCSQSKPYMNNYQQIIKQIFGRFIIENQQIDYHEIKPYLLLQNLLDSVIATNVSNITVSEFTDSQQQINQFQLLVAKTHATHKLPLKQLLLISKYVHIALWLEVQKYGFTYQLSNGCVGEFFNDQTILIESPNRVFIDYFDKVNNGWIRCRSRYCQAIAGEKKCKLHEYFKNHISKTQLQQQSLTDTYDLLLDRIFESIYMPCDVQLSDVDRSEYIRYRDQQIEGLKSGQQVVAFFSPDSQPRQGELSGYVKQFHVNSKKNEQLALEQKYQINTEFLQLICRQYVSFLCTQNIIKEQLQPDGYFSMKELQHELATMMADICQLPIQHVYQHQVNKVGYSWFLMSQMVKQYNFANHFKLCYFGNQSDAILFNDRREYIVAPLQRLQSSGIKQFSQMEAEIRRDQYLQNARVLTQNARNDP